MVVVRCLPIDEYGWRMRVLHTYSCPGQMSLAACDFDSSDRVAAVVRRSDSICIIIDGKEFKLDELIYREISNIIWVSETKVLAWPVRNDSHQYFCSIDISNYQKSLVYLGEPFMVLANKDLVACFYPEEIISPDQECPEFGDFLTVFQGCNYAKISQFSDPFMKEFRNYMALEVECAVLDGGNRYVWLLMDGSGYLWRYSVDGIRTLVAPLQCELSSVITIGCDEEHCYVIYRHEDNVRLISYKSNFENITCQDDSILMDYANFCGEFVGFVESGEIGFSGYPGKKIKFVDKRHAVLATLF